MTRTLFPAFIPAVFAAIMLSFFVSPANGQARLNPARPDLSDVLNDQRTDGKSGEEWAIVLGKALFWDIQAGSDGVACASCHFNAGADIRLTNQLSPGAKDVTAGNNGDNRFGSDRSDTRTVGGGDMPSGASAGPNYTLRENDFPLYQIQQANNRNSRVVTSTNDVVSSTAAYDMEFIGVSDLDGSETCSPANDDIFHVGGLPSRQAARRNSQTIINSVFNRRSNWDGSAANMFNGVGKHGMRDINGDPNKRLIIQEGSQPELGFVSIADASLASQAVGPVVDDIEMSCNGRTLAHVGRKLMGDLVRPLMHQEVSDNDSVFSGLVYFNNMGLAVTYTYEELIKRAFKPKYWNATGYWRVQNGQLNSATSDTGFTQTEHNFSLFWGVAIMAYESTLISNQSEFDQMVSDGTLTVRDIRTGRPFGCTANADVDELLLRGCKIFFQRRDPNSTPVGGGCNVCHGGKDTFSNAQNLANATVGPLVQNRTVLDRAGTTPGISDTGFMNTGIRPTFTDLKLGATDPYGNPLSYAQQYKNVLVAMRGGMGRQQAINANIVDPELATAVENFQHFNLGRNATTADSKVTVAGAIKSPTLRNVALTPPYSSSGMFATLRQMIQYYNRATNRRNINFSGDLDAMGAQCATGDNSGTGLDGERTYQELTQSTQSCHSNVQTGLGRLNLLDCELPGNDCNVATDDISALVRFLQSLTDRRVQCDAAPFDHPSLPLSVGHSNSDNNGDGKADDIIFELPAIGQRGYDADSGWCIPNSGDLFASGMQGRVGGPRGTIPE
ncbi:hypothetical protein DXV75_06400 [Alteromonas aestuariivivens]|uniref:Di-haem cytochrome c peroxidase domain-containing protein n=1 Tax=Alteromonas aestuariivivens TaxID=1938339 RepID=A0A3D8M9X8_9ALTE|nr:cytochrome c peroxidase [Alteromonas aestuariivivens]RDV26620.1 hypothetical protein DXV75_06400 [Alteromonas aestuariivivens]